MNEMNRQTENVRDEPTSIVPLDAQLTELIEFVWACEVAARREERLDASIRYASHWRSNEGDHIGEVVDEGSLTPHSS
jgi:hypothetical protein